MDIGLEVCINSILSFAIIQSLRKGIYFFFFFLGVWLGQGLNWKLAILVEVGVQDTVLTFE